MRLDIRDPYYLALILSWPQFLLAALAVETAVNVGFALLYLAGPGSIANARPGSFWDAFFFSLETLATVGYGVMAPATAYGHVVSSIEIFVGMGLTAVLTGLMFVRFSRPRAKIVYADRAVVALQNGQPTLMLRMGNGRSSLLTHVSVKLGALITERTEEGEVLRRVEDLRLLRSENQIFILTWTLMHTIDESSPLFGYDAERLVAEGVILFLSVDARDQALGAQVLDVQNYAADQVMFGERFADTISRDAAGHTTGDITRISLRQPDLAWPATTLAPADAGEGP